MAYGIIIKSVTVLIVTVMHHPITHKFVGETAPQIVLEITINAILAYVLHIHL